MRRRRLRQTPELVDAAPPPTPDAGPLDAGAVDATVPPPPVDVDAGGCVIPASAFTAPDPVIDVGPTETAPFGDEVRLLSLKANALVYDPRSRHLFASTPSSVGAQGNSIVTIDPVTASILGVTFIGSEPTRLALSRDGQFLYTNLRGANAVRRFDIATATAGPQFSLGTDTNGTPYNAVDLQVLPSSPHAVIVSAVSSLNAYTGPVAVYDDGVARPGDHRGLLQYPSYYGGASLLLASNSDTLVFAIDSQSTSLVEFCVNARGVQFAASQTGFASSVSQLAYASPNVYSASGSIWNAATRSFVGTLNIPPNTAPGAGVAVDAPANRAYLLAASYYTPGITAFDATHFTPTGSIGTPPLPANTNGAAQLVRWGRYGLAYLTNDGQIVLVRSPLVAQR